MSKKRCLLSGGMGFLGSHLVEGILKNTDWEIIILDRLDTSGNPNRLTDMDIWPEQGYRVRFVWWDLKSELNDFIKATIGEVDYIYHIAASSHVDRSITDPLSFVMDNVVGTCNLLNFARTLKELKLIISFGTDESFGPAPIGYNHKESDRHNPKNPYAATKVGQWALGVAFENCYKLPIIQTYCMNIFSERQHPEKFIPMVIRKVLKGEKVTIHAYPDLKRAGSRFYIHARNVCDALLFLTERGFKGYDEFNIVGEKEIDNLSLAQMIAKIIGKSLKYELTNWHQDRPGHDPRYGLDGSKMAELGWEPPKTFEESLKKTVLWYLEPKNKKWLNM